MDENLSEATQVEAGLQIIIGDQIYRAHDGDIIGREGSIAKHYFSTIPTVSRQHVFIVKEKGNWYIQVPESVANETKLDGVEIIRGKLHILLGEHILKLSEKCVVRVKAD